MQNAKSTPPEVLAPGITFERILDGNCAVFTLSDLTRVSIDAWGAKIRELTGNWTNDRPFLALTEVTGKYISLTPYLRSRMEEISHWHPDLWAFTAVVLPPSFFTQLMSLFVPTLKLRNAQTRFFRTREEAAAWLDKSFRESQGKTPPTQTE